MGQGTHKKTNIENGNGRKRNKIARKNDDRDVEYVALKYTNGKNWGS